MLCSTNCSLTEALRARESVSRQKYEKSHLTVHPVTVQKQKVNDFLTFVKYLCIIYSMTAVILCAQNGKFCSRKLFFPRGRKFFYAAKKFFFCGEKNFFSFKTNVEIRSMTVYLVVSHCLVRRLSKLCQGVENVA